MLPSTKETGSADAVGGWQSSQGTLVTASSFPLQKLSVPSTCTCRAPVGGVNETSNVPSGAVTVVGPTSAAGLKTLPLSSNVRTCCTSKVPLDVLGGSV